MKKAYIVLAHKNPDQLYRLIERLDDGSSKVYLHIDKRIPISEFQGVERFGHFVQMVKRVPSAWASIGNVLATLNAMQAIKESGVNYGQVILLSGQDYPIKAAEEIDRAYEESPYSIFFEYWPMPDFERWPHHQGGMYRVNKYFIGMKSHEIFCSKSLNFIGNLIPPLSRKVPERMQPYAGSTWWSIDMYGLNYVLDYVNKHPGYINYHKYTFGSDELFFHMILLNSTDEKLLSRIENNNKRFIRWQTTSIAHPDILQTEDLDQILESPGLFARKFDMYKDEQILDLIDEHCLMAV
ncbi:beta-1,6-N-acetylglucosaminyltransferase [Pedobacter sp. SYSU D00535]|uniref:beta-1,6-N-acetylglucosaminyltransferase n=1 Tax=Pedobacter sp. SYSU D00535 TaxID=2810308 RepID=UPI001A97BAA9|nr:beta-1,6-N-acetylglucosaminyltransferase [Pedobacter sp. SYSU D00535]